MCLKPEDPSQIVQNTLSFCHQKHTNLAGSYNEMIKAGCAIVVASLKKLRLIFSCPHQHKKGITIHLN